MNTVISGEDSGYWGTLKSQTGCFIVASRELDHYVLLDRWDLYKHKDRSLEGT